MAYVTGRDRLGSPMTTALVSAGANAVVPGSGAIAGAAASLFGGLFGGGSQRDKDRIARVSYFYNLAVAGNVGAAQVMLGAIPDVAGDEQGYWQTALQKLSSLNPPVYNAALAAGGVRFSGQGDSATNYPHMQAYALNWDANNAPIGAPTGAAGNAVARVAQSLPPMRTTAGYNWWPVAIGATAVAGAALVLFNHSPRRR